MLSNAVLSALAAASLASGQLLRNEEADNFRCDFPNLDHMEIHQFDHLVDYIQPARADITVDMVFHILAGDETREQGYLSEEEVAAQLAVIETAFEPHGIHFNFLGARYDINETHFTGAPPGEQGDFEESYRQRLHEGGYTTLNVYFPHSRFMSGSAGRCTHPQLNFDDPDKVIQDGCQVFQNTLPGSDRACCNEGETAVHEIGHWFGLWHTFEPRCTIEEEQGCTGCTGMGDLVEDTPPMNSIVGGRCNEAQDSCPDLPGLDSVRNFMSYEHDFCIDHFTPGQGARMHMIYQEYRVAHESAKRA